jgi:hypothetical protein
MGAIALGRWIRDRPHWQGWLAMALGGLPFFLLSLNLVSHETYRGSSRGFEFTLVDLVAWSLLFALPRVERRSRVRGVYLAICIISALFAAVPLYSTFGIWKVVRTFWIAAAAYRAVIFGHSMPLLQGVVLGQLYALGIALEQRYILGLHQVSGPFAHQNGLAQAAVLVYALCLSVSLGPARSRWASAGALAALGCVVLTLSRGGIAMILLASVAVFLLSAYRHRDPRLIKIALVGLLGIAAVGIRAGDTLTERFTEAPDASAHGRDLFEKMAERMVEDNPFVGVGMNHYSYANEHLGYADEVGMPEIDRGGVAHHVYWLTLAELGYQGLAAFLLMYIIPVLRAFRHALTTAVAVNGDVLQGLAVGTMAVLIQGQLEYTLRLTMVSQLVWVYIGVIGAMVAMSRSQFKALSIRSM